MVGVERLGVLHFHALAGTCPAIGMVSVGTTNRLLADDARLGFDPRRFFYLFLLQIAQVLAAFHCVLLGKELLAGSGDSHPFHFCSPPLVSQGLRVADLGKLGVPGSTLASFGLSRSYLYPFLHDDTFLKFCHITCYSFRNYALRSYLFPLLQLA